MNRTKIRIAALLLAAAVPTATVARAQAPTGPTTATVFQIKQADVEMVAEMVQQLYPQIHLVVQPGPRLLIVKGSVTDLKELNEIIPTIDRPSPPTSTHAPAPSSSQPRATAATISPTAPTPKGPFAREPTDPSLATLRDQYRSHEQQAQQFASQARGAAQQPVQAALGMDPGASDGRAKDGASPQATPQLREQVTKAFEARQQLLRVELEQFRQRLARIEQTLEAREQLKQTIIDQRIKELVNPALEWEPNTQVPSDTTKPATTTAPTAPVAAPTARLPTSIDLSRKPDKPTTSTTPSPEKPTRQVVMLRERVKLAMDQLLKGGATIDEAIREVKALTEAEELIDNGAPAFPLEQLARWQKLKQIAVDLVKRGSQTPAKSLEVQTTVDEAIDLANQQFRQRLPQFLKSPRELERELAEANEAWRRAQALPQAESKALEAAMKRLNSVNAQNANQLELVTVRLRYAMLELERLQLGASEIAGPEADKQKKLVAAAARRVSQWAGLANLYRQAVGQGARRVSLGSDRKSDDEEQGIADARLWYRIGLELRPGGGGFDQQRGLLVTGVKNASPADTAGIKIRDLVLGVNGVETLSAADVSYLISENPSLTVASFHILREGKPLTEVMVEFTASPDALPVVISADPPSGLAPSKVAPSSSATKPIGEIPPKKSPSKDVPAIQVPATKPSGEVPPKIAPPRPDSSAGEADELWQMLGMRFQQVGRERVTASANLRGGLEVKEIRKDSPPNAAGLRVGDILVGAGQWETLTQRALLLAIRFGRPEKEVLEVHLLRDDRLISSKIPMKDEVFSFFLGFAR